MLLHQRVLKAAACGDVPWSSRNLTSLVLRECTGSYIGVPPCLQTQVPHGSALSQETHAYKYTCMGDITQTDRDTGNISMHIIA